MAGKTQYLERALLDHVFGKTTYTGPATVYLGLFTAAPSDAGGGTEVTGGSYARASLTNNTTNFTNATGSSPASKTTGAALTYPAPTANWGTVTHFGIFDASSAGNLLYWAALTTSKTINNGDAAPSFAIGALTITED